MTSAQVARNVNLHVFETLYARDENARPVPDLAEGVTVSARWLTYVFTLRRGVKFHNGREMASADVVASLERYRKVGASASLIGAIDTIAATGPNQVTIKLKSVQSTFLSNLSSPRAPIAIMPVEEAARKAARHPPSAPVHSSSSNTSPTAMSSWRASMTTSPTPPTRSAMVSPAPRSPIWTP